jgi:uncharacterized cysteine cluster protein YcgN (CxxCxxCC family)
VSPFKIKDWEDVCLRCGRCCFEKLEFEGQIYYTDTPCEKLNLATGLCTVYVDRVTARPGCTPLTPAILHKGILPADCPYVAGIETYLPPHLFQGD